MTLALRARPTTYNGIPMRSRLEARFAAFLDRAGLEWEYEPQAFADQRGQYLPDFLVRNLGTSSRVYVEVKGATPPFEENQRMAVILASDPDAILVVLADEEAKRDLTRWADIGFSALGHWGVGGWCICSCGHPRLFLPVCYWLPGQMLGGMSESELDEPRSLCSFPCARRVAAYINPFAA